MRIYRALPLSLCLAAVLAISPPVPAQSPPAGLKADSDLSRRARTHIVDSTVTIAVAGVLEDFWDVGGQVDFDLADGVLTVVSDDGNDTCGGASDPSPADPRCPSGGTGAWILRLDGNTCEAQPKFQSVFIDMDGTTPVVTGVCFQGFSLAQARVVQSPSLNARQAFPIGEITITQGATVVGKINPGEEHTHNGFRRIPYGPDGEVETWTIIGGDLNLLDPKQNPDAVCELSLWTYSTDSQVHTDGRTVLQASIEVFRSLVFGESFSSSQSFSLSADCDTSGAILFANLLVAVTVPFPVDVRYTVELN